NLTPALKDRAKVSAPLRGRGILTLQVFIPKGAGKEVSRKMAITITNVIARDIRFPTSATLDGSDAVNLDPDDSATYVILETARRYDARADYRVHSFPTHHRCSDFWRCCRDIETK